MNKAWEKETDQDLKEMCVWKHDYWWVALPIEKQITENRRRKGKHLWASHASAHIISYRLNSSNFITMQCNSTFFLTLSAGPLTASNINLLPSIQQFYFLHLPIPSQKWILFYSTCSLHLLNKSSRHHRIATSIFPILKNDYSDHKSLQCHVTLPPNRTKSNGKGKWEKAKQKAERVDKSRVVITIPFPRKCILKWLF